MDKRSERILRKAGQAGLKKTLHDGRLPSRKELLAIKVQVLPDYARWCMLGGSGFTGAASWICFSTQMWVAGSILALVSVFLLLFSAFGIRNTLETIADSISYDIVSGVFDIIGSAIGSVSD